MNIVIFACVDFPEGPATTSRIKLFARILTKAGHKVSLAVFNANAKTPIPENRSDLGIHDSVDYRYLSGNTVRPTRFFDAIIDSLTGIARSVSYLRSKRKACAVDVVLLYNPDIFRSLPCLIQSQLHGIPVLLELCELFSTDMRKHGVKPSIKRLGARLADKLLPGMCTGVFAISTRIVDYLKQNGLNDKRIMHLPILVDCDRFIRPSFEQVPTLLHRRYFLNSGALDSKEGLEHILEAFASLGKVHEDLLLVLTGAPDDKRKTSIRHLADKLGVEQRLVLTGFLTADQLVWAYQNAVALICCRADTAFANYGFPTKLGEYLAAGRPVITNDVGDTTLYLRDGENAFLARAQDSRSIAVAMERVLDSPELAYRIGLNGRKTALENFEYSNFIQPLDEFLRIVCPE